MTKKIASFNLCSVKFRFIVQLQSQRFAFRNPQICLVYMNYIGIKKLTIDFCQPMKSVVRYDLFSLAVVEFALTCTSHFTIAKHFFQENRFKIRQLTQFAQFYAHLIVLELNLYPTIVCLFVCLFAPFSSSRSRGWVIATMSCF